MANYDFSKLTAIKVGLASPEKILEWSYGEVTKPETINYRSEKPEQGGLFCEKIFGPTKDYECFCGKVKTARFQGTICEKCGVECTTKSVRRERMGHIELATPVAHIWYVRGIPSRIAQVLDIPPKKLEEVVYFVSHICLKTGDCDKLTYRGVVDEREGRTLFGSILQDIQTKIDEDGLFNKCSALVSKIKNDSLEDVYTDVINIVSAIKDKHDTSSVLTDDIKLSEVFRQPMSNEAREKAVMVLEGLKTIIDESGDLIKCDNLISKLNNPKEIFNFDYIVSFISKYYPGVQFGFGAEAILTLLKEVNVEEEFNKIKAEIVALENKKSGKKSKASTEAKTQNNQKRQKLLKRLEVIDAFRHSDNKPEWMILTRLPVIPPDLRPMIKLDGGRYATTDLNELYRRVIIRNDRLKKDLAAKAPSLIVMNEMRLLQAAVDDLIENGKKGKPATGAGGSNRPLKSLTVGLKGKQGRFRQNLLGKRVDYSGRSVIAVGPNLKMYQCGVPREMALQLFKPFITCELIKKGYVTTQKAADRLIDGGDDRVMKILEELVLDHPVLLNRAPTLHRLSIQAFEIKLVEGRAIRLHPLVCTAFNADFDGDQMAIHVPLSEEAIEEARQIMLGSKNILGPKDGKTIVTPSQDMLLGNYYLTTEYTKEDFLKQAKKYRSTGNKEKAVEFENYANTEGKVYNDINEVKQALDNKDIHLHSRIAVRGKGLHKANLTEEQKNCYLVTSAGRFIFNQIFPDYFPFLITTAAENFEATPDRFFLRPGTNIKEAIAAMPVNPPFKKKDLGIIINESFALCGKEETSKMLDKLKDQGFYYSTVSAVTVSLSDILVYDKKQETLAAADEKVKQLNAMAARGLLTNEERHKLVCKVWTDLIDEKNEMAKGIAAQLKADPTNPVYIMSDSGARGSASNFMQLSGMRGIMENPSGDQIEIPIKSSFREGLTVSEYFISSHGARKGGADTALKTSTSGYLTRRLVDVSQNVVVREDDCGTDHGTIVRDLVDDKLDAKDNKPVETFEERILGRYPMHDVYNPKTKELICSKDEIIDEAKVKEIKAADIHELEIRSVFSCKTRDGVCCKCYGRNLATGLPVIKGEAVGVMAAQSIGEPGTQLTMKNFHTGGVAGGEDITQGLPRVIELFEARNPKREAFIADFDGKVVDIKEDKETGIKTVTIKGEKEEKEYKPPFDARLRVEKGMHILKGQKITEGAISPKHLLEVTNQVEVQNYILREVLKVYGANGIGISDKHIEIIVRQMFKYCIISSAGDTELIPGTKTTISHYEDENAKALMKGKKPAVGHPIVLGVTKAAIETDSFLSSASFQETTKVLTDAATKGKVDYLHGLKENIIIGKLIPAGTTINPLHFESKFKKQDDNVTVEVAPADAGKVE